MTKRKAARLNIQYTEFISEQYEWRRGTIPVSLCDSPSSFFVAVRRQDMYIIKHFVVIEVNKNVSHLLSFSAQIFGIES